MKRITLLGSTGSIGTQTLEVCDILGDVKIIALTANRNMELLYKQIKKYKPDIAVLYDEEAAAALKKRTPPCDVLSGMEGLITAARANADMVVNALVGGIGLLPTIAAIESGADIALANKETLVAGGELVINAARKKNVKLIPIDSEHSAIFQCIEGHSIKDINKLILTASGGPFRGYNKQRLENVTLEQALLHPNWVMGDKITIDSATMMNKGFEVIEAKWLFGVSPDMIDVLVHPQSIIHSMVEFKDGHILAQLGRPDMRMPIMYALTYPKRIQNSLPVTDFTKFPPLTFEAPDTDVFPCLSLAYGAIKTGGTLPACLNYANEYAVTEFLNKRIRFADIPILIKDVCDRYTVRYDFDMDDLNEAYDFARAVMGGG